jgi:hypothetical protein
MFASPQVDICVENGFPSIQLAENDFFVPRATYQRLRTPAIRRQPAQPALALRSTVLRGVAQVSAPLSRLFIPSLPCAIRISQFPDRHAETHDCDQKFLAGIGRINEAPFEDVANKLGWKYRKTGSMAVRILLVHHHIALTEDLEPTSGYPRGFGLAIDAVRIQRLAASYGVQLAIHGHKHRAFLWRSSVFELPENTKPNYYLGDLAIVGGGSAGSTDTDAKSNYFNLLTMTASGIYLDVYRSRDGGAFESMQQWRASFSLAGSTRQLALGLWELMPPLK